MKAIGKIIQLLDTQMETPDPYGWFHILFMAITVALCIFILIRCKNSSPKSVRLAVLITSIVVIVLEIYKQFNYSFTYDGNTVVFDFLWYAFPFQFCSTPMLVGLVAGLTKKGRIHQSLCAYLATFATFAGLCVTLYPTTVFIGTVGINIQTMICHCSMIVIGVLLWRSGYVKAEHKTILKALPVFATCVVVAMIMNEIAFRTGLLETDTFNMFFISPYCEPSLPVYSLIQNVVPFPLCVLIYFLGFSLAAYIISLIPMLCKKIVRKHS